MYIRFQYFFVYMIYLGGNNWCKSRKETPQKLTQLSSRSHPRHLVGKRTAQKDITIDTTITGLSYLMLPKQSIIQYIMYINFYINAPHQPIEIWGRNVQGAKRPIGAKRPGAKRPGAKCPGGESSRGGNGFGTKRPGTREVFGTQFYGFYEYVV